MVCCLFAYAYGLTKSHQKNFKGGHSLANEWQVTLPPCGKIMFFQRAYSGTKLFGSSNKYIYGHYNLLASIIDLVSHTTHVVYINFLHKWRDLQFKGDSEWQIFWKFYLLSQVLPEICCEVIAEEKLLVFYFNDWIGAQTLALRHKFEFALDLNGKSPFSVSALNKLFRINDANRSTSGATETKTTKLRNHRIFKKTQLRSRHWTGLHKPGY